VRKKKRMPAVVDTNVPIVANHKGEEPLACAAACADALHEITRTGLLVIDEGGLIFGEYKTYLSFAGQPGAGDYFFKWLSDNRYKPDRVARVALAEDPARPGQFAAFPADEELRSFDQSDRKFVAAALTHPERPPVLDATDSDWWDFRNALRPHGVTIRFVCGEDRFREE
jgi:hypothetical protein